MHWLSFKLVPLTVGTTLELQLATIVSTMFMQISLLDKLSFNGMFALNFARQCFIVAVFKGIT